MRFQKPLHDLFAATLWQWS